jgi:UDP-glucose 6-dehydrogenase
MRCFWTPKGCLILKSIYKKTHSILIIKKPEFLREIGVLNKNAFSLDRVNVGSKQFFTSAQGILPQVLNTLLTENEGFLIHQTPTCNVLHTCYTKMLPISCQFKTISSGLNRQNVYKCFTSSIS